MRDYGATATAREIHQSIRRGHRLFQKERPAKCRGLKKKLRSDGPSEDFLALSYDVYASKQYERAPYPSLAGVKTVLEFLAQENPKARNADPDSFIDNSIIKELDASGFIRDLHAP